MRRLADGLPLHAFPAILLAVTLLVLGLLAGLRRRLGRWFFPIALLACAAALTNLRIVEQEELPANAGKVGAYLLARLKDIQKRHPNMGDVRGKGLMVGIELVADKNRNKPFDPKLRIGASVCARVRNHGVILRPLGDVIVLMPPLAMTMDDIEKIVSAVYREIAAIRI